MLDNDLHPPLSVKPRRRRYPKLPVVAVDWQDIEDVVVHLKDYPPTLFVMEGSADFLAILDSYWHEREPESWQFRISENERAIHTPGTQRAAARVSVVVTFFGFKNGNYHRLIDPVTMYGQPLDKIWPGEESRQARLFNWGWAISKFCDENQMEVRPTIGSLSSQFWTDRRFYPNPRRKVPHATNAQARERLPGNYYELLVMPTPDQDFTAHYLDQRRAHHYHARTTPMPHADSLYAYGDFKNLKDTVWTDVLPDFYGLQCVTLELPENHGSLHWIKPAKRHFIFTNELPHLLDLGYKITGVIAAWGSFARDEGVARYATFAETQLDRYSDGPWLKPLLLAAYGTLATRPTLGETIFRLASGGQDVEITTGRHRINGKLTRRPHKLEPGIANVIHRGMIEAATRSDSVGLAQHLTGLRHRVLSIYADAVIVEANDDRPLPVLPEPWRLKKTLNRLQFINLQAFVSDEMTKLPGVGRDFLRYKARSIGHAPRKVLYESPSGLPATTTTPGGRRIVKTKGRI